MNNSKTSLFLMELIIVILFFSLCGAVCVQLFMNTHTIDEETSESSNATIIQQSLCECFLNTNGDLEAISKIYANSIVDTNTNSLTVHYDNTWTELSKTSGNTSADTSSYTYEIVVSSDYNDSDSSGRMIHGEVQVLRSDDTIISSQKLNKYIPLRMEGN